MDAFEKKPRLSIAWAFILLRLVEGAGISSLYVFLPNTVADFFASESSQETIHCSDYDRDDMPDVCLHAHSKAILVTAIKDLIGYGVLSFLLNPLFGAWSDTYGRKPFLVLNELGFIIPKLFVYLYAQWDLSLYGYFLASIAVTALQNLGILFAYIGDVVPAESKNFYFAMLFSAESLGVMVGSGLVLTGLVGSVKQASLLGVCSNAIGTLVIIFVLPETAHFSGQRGTRTRISFYDVISILTQNKIFVCLSICVVAAGAAQMDGNGEIFGQYLLEASGFTTKDIAVAAAIICISLLSIPAIVYILTSVMQLNNTSVLMVCFSVMFIQFSMLALAMVKPIAFLAVTLTAFTPVVLTTVSSMMAEMVSADQQGAVQGSITAVRSAVTGIFPWLFLGIFTAFRTHVLYFPGAAMLMIAVVQLVGFFASRKSGQYMAEHLSSLDIEMPGTVMYKPVGQNEEQDQQ